MTFSLRPLAARPAFLALASLALLSASGSAQTVQDPFAPGMRWSHGAEPSLPWIPRDVAMVLDGEFSWVGEAVGSPAVTLLGGTHDGSLETIFRYPLPNALNVVDVEAGPGIEHLYAAVQFPGGPQSAGRTTQVMGFDGFQSSSPNTWTRTLSPEVKGGVQLAVDGTGNGIFVARHDPYAGRIDLDRLDPADGASLFSTSFSAGSLRGIEVSEDGNRVLVALGGGFRLLDGGGTTLIAQTLPVSTEAFDLSADGATFAFGDHATLHIFTETPSGYAETMNVVEGPEWMATRLAVSDNGSGLAVGWWNFQTGQAIRFQLWDLAAQAKLHEVTQTGLGGGLQNFPQDVAISRDGDRAVLGAWGSGGPDPQLIMMDRNQATPIFSTYLPGSVTALDLNSGGERLIVAMKGAHSNQFTTLGYVQAFDTGERDLQFVGATRTGNTFQVSSKDSGSLQHIFVFGTPLPTGASSPQTFGIEGSLGLDPLLPYQLYAKPADAFGRADLVGIVPPSPTLVGLEIGVQAVFVRPFNLKFSGSICRPTIL
ncbi:MAG: hypothetical protein P8R48_10495 [Planctomycetota bacterium]|nr:hypothetical protein [Planctomycetota bacterium]